jgi:serine phosphatase RsbU (regulator of sigma subunit)
METTATLERTEAKTLKCLEIWGGNHAIDSGVSVPGIDGWVLSRPIAGNEVGGDVHYVSLCGGHRLARFAVADISGHGPQTDHVAAMLRNLVRKHIGKLDQTRFLQALNGEFTSLAASGTYATAVLASYYAPIDHLVVCNAGHPKPLWYHASTGVWEYLEERSPRCVSSLSNLPLGIVHLTRYHQFAVPLQKDDVVLIYTDALLDARDPQGRALAEEGLLGLVSENGVDEPALFCHSLLDAVIAHQGGAAIDDDVTIMLLHHNASNAPRISASDVARFAGAVLGLVKI